MTDWRTWPTLHKGTQILSESGHHAALHDVRQRAHRQEWQGCLRLSLVPASKLRAVPGAAFQELDDAPAKPNFNPASHSHRTIEPARCRARLWRGANQARWLAYEETFPERTHRLCGKAEGETNPAERRVARRPGA